MLKTDAKYSKAKCLKQNTLQNEKNKNFHNIKNGFEKERT